MEQDPKEPTRSSRVLEDLLDQEPDYFTLGCLMSTLHQRSLGLVMLLLGLLAHEGAALLAGLREGVEIRRTSSSERRSSKRKSSACENTKLLLGS
jgi:hypothetical protein